MGQESLSEIFERFAEGAKDSSLFYSKLAKGISQNEEILNIVDKVKVDSEPVHLHFLYAVHYLLLSNEVEHELQYYYPSKTDKPKLEDLVPTFKSFCLEYKDEIGTIMQEKKVQTHEVRRCTTLIPGFAYLNQKVGGEWTIIEIGSSAGLNLYWDDYSYNFNGKHVGKIDSAVQLDCEIRSGNPPLTDLPKIDNRIGIDLNPLDLNENDNLLWLQAMIWPDQPKRMKLLRNAIEQNKDKSHNIIRGNATKVLPNIINNIPSDQNICIYQTISVYLFSEDDTEKLYRIMKQASNNRDIYFLSLSLDNPMEGKTELKLETYRKGDRRIEVLANCHYHGKWIEWDGS